MIESVAPETGRLELWRRIIAPHHRRTSAATAAHVAGEVQLA
jgi:hypothetical protein